MKKLVLVLGLIGSAVSGSYAATQYQNLGNVAMSSSTLSGGIALWTQTAAQLLVLTPSTTNQLIICSNCTQGGSQTVGTSVNLCVSSGTGNGAWVEASSAPLVCK